jgi:hypothetical protein
MRRYENMTDDEISRAIAQYRETIRALEKHLSYLDSGNGLPKDEISRSQLQFSNSKIAEQLRGYIRDLEAEQSFRAAN